MKILHTADWHLGQLFYQNDRSHEHQAFLNWLKEMLLTHAVDALLIAGDIFDTPNPSASAQRMLYGFLKDIHQQDPALQVVIIAGNHDSAYRLEAPTPLLDDMQVHVKGAIKRDENGKINYNDLIVKLTGTDRTTVWCMAVPYLRQGDYPAVDLEQGQNIYNEGTKSFYSNMLQHVQERRKENEPIIAMGHLQASGAYINSGDESERSIVGGLEGVNGAALFPASITYTALGHLHRAQRVAGRDNITYSGSPLPMSFAEENYKHGVNLVNITGDKQAVIEKLIFEPPVRVMSIPARIQPLGPEEPNNLEQVKKLLKELPKGEPDKVAPYLQVRVSFRQMIPNLRQEVEKMLEGRYVRLARIITDNANTFEAESEEAITFEKVKNIEPIDMARLAFRRKELQMPAEIEQLFNDVVDEINREN